MGPRTPSRSNVLVSECVLTWGFREEGNESVFIDVAYFESRLRVYAYQGAARPVGRGCLAIVMVEDGCGRNGRNLSMLRCSEG